MPLARPGRALLERRRQCTPSPARQPHAVGAVGRALDELEVVLAADVRPARAGGRRTIELAENRVDRRPAEPEIAQVRPGEERTRRLGSSAADRRAVTAGADSPRSEERECVLPFEDDVSRISRGRCVCSASQIADDWPVGHLRCGRRGRVRHGAMSAAGCARRPPTETWIGAELGRCSGPGTGCRRCRRNVGTVAASG